MKTFYFIVAIIIETVVTIIIIYLKNKFKTMDILDYFIFTIGLIAIASTTVYYLLNRKLDKHNKVLIKHRRTMEYVMFFTNTTDKVNQKIKETKMNIGLLGLEETDDDLLNQRKGKKS